MWTVHKFGGTSVGNENRIKSVGELLLKSETDPKIQKAIVVSAMKGVTDIKKVIGDIS